MANVFDAAREIPPLSRRVGWPLRILRELPALPLLILAVLVLVALLAPVIAPHGKIDPVHSDKGAMPGEVRHRQLSLCRQPAALLG